MKKLYILFILLTYNAFSQDLNMQSGSFNRCAPDVFYDSGGAGGAYGSNENFVTTICSLNAGEFIILEFTEFNTQLSADVMTLYDGTDTAAPVIGTYSGVAGPGTVIPSAGNTSGCITIEFVSDGMGTTTGWAANIICAVPCQTITPSIDSTVPDVNAAGVVLINAGGQVDFNASATFSSDGTGATYDWNFGDTNTGTGTSVSNIYANPGTYTVTLTVTDDNPVGCSESTTITVFVLGPNVVIDQTTFTVEELIQDVLIDSPCAQVSNITFSTGTNFGDDNGIGYFISNGSDFPFTDGIIMTSGNASEARGPNNIGMSAGGFGWPGDAELDAAVGINSNNASIIEFDFVPLADSISFEFLMASEEYDMGSFECNFSDAFAFLLTDSAGNTTNLAVLPGTTTPILVTNIHLDNGACPGINEQYFGGYTPNNGPPIAFDGRTAVFTAQSPVIPGDNYSIKLVVADASDTALDSGVFLQAGSFNLGGDLGDDITIVAGNAECGGEIVTLDTQAPTATHVWYKDGIEIPGETSSTLDVSEAGIYSVDVIFSGACQASDSVIVEYKPVPVANIPPNLTICSTTGTGEFILTDNDSEILGAQDPTEFIISYHLIEQDAIDNINPLASPYTNISNPQTIWARIGELSQECFAITSFDLEFVNLNINAALTPQQVCDDNNDGFASFNLADTNVEVIAALDPATVTVSYHLSFVDADTDVNPLPIPYTNSVMSAQTIWVRVEANGTTDCYNITTLDLFVNPLPVPITPTPLEVCDDDNDGFSTFNLILKDAEILGGQTGMTVTYHETVAEAETGVNPQASPYSNLSANSQIIIARLEDDTTGCADTVELLLVVNPLPAVSAISNYELCDYNAPGDEIEVFDLSTKDMEAINGQTGVTVSYHATQTDAETGASPLPNLYSNTSTPQTIFVNITNTTSNCNSVGSFDLIVNPLPALVAPTPLAVCDDGTPDGITIIDLTLKNVEVTGNNPNYSVSYHIDQFDADNNLNPLAIPYTNLFNGQIVFVRVQDINTGCYDTTTLELVVEQAPIANTPTPLLYCDPDSDGFGVFDLTSKDIEITGGDPALTVSYHETMADANNNVNALTSPYNNIVENQQTVYVRVESSTIATACATIVELQLIVSPTPQLGSAPTALEVCDDLSADGFAQFDLTSKIPEILQNLADPTLYTVTFYETEMNADMSNNPIATPANYTNTTAFNQILWVRVEDIDPATGCYKLTTLELIVNALPVLLQPAPLELCDDNNPGDEVEFFMLEDATDEILNGQTGISLTYFATQADADNNTNAITSPYENTSNPQTIFVRATNDVTGCFVSTTATILLRVNPIPSPTVPTDLEECDEDNDGFTEFNLEDRTLEIIGGELDIAITYHETQQDAETGDNALASPYTNIVMDEQMIYIRATNTVTGCYNASEVLIIRVLESPEVPVTIVDYVICDTNSDGITQFDLTTKDAEILGGQTDVTLTYHVTAADALTGNNAIANVGNYTNTSNPQTIYVRLVSNINGCVDVGQFDLRVELPPVAVQPTPLELCDDEIDDEITVFDLTVKDVEITGGEASWSVSYYETDVDAQAQTNAVDAGAYTNTSVNGLPANPQTLYVVVTDTDTGCVDFTTLTIRVLPNPTPTEVLPELVLCDDINPGDMEEVFDLTTNEVLLLNGEVGVTPSYHETLEDAEEGINAIADPTMYTNTSTPQLIYVRVTNDITGCYTIVNFTLLVNPLPDVVAVTDFIACELNNDGFYDFDLTLKDAEVLNGQDATLFTVTYHETQADADALINALVSPYTNLTNPQQIFVAITNNDTGCSISTPSFNIEVQEAAEANSDMEPIVFEICDDEMDDDNDPTNNSAQFDLTLQNDAILDGQDPANYIVSYYASEADAELGVNPLPFLYENVVNPQVIWARVDNDTLDVAGMDTSICYAVAPLTLQVNPLPVFDLEDSYILCVDTNGSEVLNLPVLETGLDTGQYTFVWFFNGTEIAGATDSSYMPSEGGTYSVTVTDVTSSPNTMCESSDITEVIESSPPTVMALVVSLDFADVHVIEVTVEGSGDYEYSLDGGPWQDDNIFTDVSIGDHTVTVRDKIGCGEASDDVTVMDYPKFFTPNGDGYNDTWNITDIDNQPNAKIYIFDRYGKLIKQLSPSGIGWNGTYNGNPMPTSDYWFVVEYNERSTGERKEFKAHFTLKR
ncbi:gliding motility-associated C-terminal domain-containing protein [Formosa sp. Hel1_31_208]|uniref:choice-of-anchor L domain-containing protein n=1 Tax=Formosa sp. Hel1_31_208 TaxID=1798225 RepID=UPI00087A83C3|nr:choice-of-anchor L domain-containing protein [Formosa sp. Hel1_31_208]SDR67155.1 gliding motility-associated C-terminal domain-containing protein [Formosa sp. Hel1_31_208]